ncbi:hypothetical protein MTO96_010195, partial [Rhipicephalus appendiculatus]
MDYLLMLNRINELSIVIILTITDDGMTELMPSSSWDKTCLPQPNQPTMLQALKAILRIPNPSVNYTLTISLRLDVFYGASLPASGTNTLQRRHVLSHETRSFSE